MKFLSKLNRLHLEWFGCLVISSFILLWSFNAPWLNGLNSWWYDKILLSKDTSNNNDIVIITIDDKSISQLGAWPWPRNVHANLLKKLRIANPKNIGINILFSESSNNTLYDDELASALQQLQFAQIPVYLPISSSGELDTSSAHNDLELNRPLPLFENVVEGLGHTFLHLDNDGKLRKMYLWEGNTTSIKWPSLALLMTQSNKKTKEIKQIAINNRIRFFQNNSNLEFLKDYPQWSVQAPVYLPFNRNENHIQKISYTSILNNEVDLNELTNKYILIGATATGIKDQYPTPLTANYSLMSGIEIHATLLDGILNNKLIQEIKNKCVISFALFLLLIWSIFLWKITPSKNIGLLIILFILITGANYILHWYYLLYWPIAINILALIIPFLLWNWRRFSFLIIQLNKRAQFLFANKNKPEKLIIENDNPKDGWQSIVKTLDIALNAQNDRKLFLLNTLQAMPEAVLLTDANGVILLSNERAKILSTQDIVIGSFATDILSIYSENHKVDNWAELMSKAISNNGVEVTIEPNQTNDLKAFLLRAHTAEFLNTAIDNPNSNGIHPAEVRGWIIVLVDITLQKKLQLQRDQALQLLSHDFRAPQSALLHLIKQQEQIILNLQAIHHYEKLTHSLMIIDQMRVQTATTLKLADDFVWMLRAQSEDFTRQEINLENLLQQVSDRAWPLAHEKNISLHLDLKAIIDLPCYIMADGNLLERALFNLLDNAIKYSNKNTAIQITVNLVAPVSKQNQTIEILIIDSGRGINQQDLPNIFEKYSRMHTYDQSIKGHGLGLAFVYKVIQQHGGSISCKSEVNLGTEFKVILHNTILVEE